jgi:hypothetical protein
VSRGTFERAFSEQAEREIAERAAGLSPAERAEAEAIGTLAALQAVDGFLRDNLDRLPRAETARGDAFWEQVYVIQRAVISGLQDEITARRRKFGD